MTTETQNPTPLTDTGSEEAAIAALSQRGNAPVASEQEPESNPEDGETTPTPEDAEPEEGDTEDAEETEAEAVEVEYEGKTYTVAPEIQKALLRQSDYSRKMNEVGEVEKIAKSRNEQAEKLIAGAEKFAEALAEVNGIDAQIAQFDKLDWTKLRSENPAEYAALVADRQTLDASRKAVIEKAKSIDAELSGAKQIQLQEKRLDMLKTLQKDLKGWGDELGSKITQYARSVGYSDDDLGNTADARLVIALDKARRYDDLQKSKGDLQAKAKAAPVYVKPGTPKRIDKTAELMTRFRKTASTEDAIALLEARQKR